MADTTFVNGTTLTDADWFNDLNRLHYTILSDPADVAAVKTALAIAAAAAQSDQETATSTTTYVSPGRQQFHPSAAKASCLANVNGTNAYAYNCDSPTDNGTGDININFTTDFSGASFAFCANSIDANTTFAKVNTMGAGTVRVFCLTLAATLADPTVGYSVIAHGDQA